MPRSQGCGGRLWRDGVPDTPDKSLSGTGITGAAEAGWPVVDRSRGLPGDPWNASGVGRGDVGDGAGGAAPPVIEGDNRRISEGTPRTHTYQMVRRSLCLAVSFA